MDIVMTHDDGTVSTGLDRLKKTLEYVAIGAVHPYEAFERLYVNDSGLLVEVSVKFLGQEKDEQDYAYTTCGLVKKSAQDGEPLLTFTYTVDGRA